MTAPAPRTRPIYYRPIQRHWYRLLDFVQYVWHRFSASLIGRVIIWLSVHVVYLAIRVAVMLVVASIVVGCMVLYITLSTCLGNGALMKGVKKGGG